MSDTGKQCDVLVVGFGPVGAVLTALLGQFGRRVIAIEQQRDIYPLPRAAHIDHEIMRIFQALGVAERIAQHVRVAPNYEFRTADGQAMLRFERIGAMGASGWPVGFNVYQPGIERAVRARVAELDRVETLYSTSFKGVADGDGRSVTVAITDEAGERREINARFVVGCDGAWSPVREACGIGLDDYGFDEPWLVLDAVVPDESGFPEDNLQLCDPERPTTFVHMGPGRLRWEFMLKPDEDPADMRSPERVDALLARWRRFGAIEVERVAVYRFHGLVARDWRVGRVLLAGDAAHQMPPFLGQGLCSGLRDAANLAWKLDAVLASDDLALLDSYQAERDPHVRFVIERAIEMGRLVCTLDPAEAAARDAEMLADPQVDGPTALPDIQGLTLDGSAGAGAIFPQPLDAAGGRLDDQLGQGAWLLHRSVEGPDAPGLRVVALSELPPDLARAVDVWLCELGAAAVLVRPDRYVFGTGEPAALIAAWRKRVAPERVAA